MSAKVKKGQYFCCCCSLEFDTVCKASHHCFEKYISEHGEESYKICGLNVWFCIGCQKHYGCWENYKKHFERQ